MRNVEDRMPLDDLMPQLRMPAQQEHGRSHFIAQRCRSGLLHVTLATATALAVEAFWGSSNGTSVRCIVLYCNVQPSVLNCDKWWINCRLTSTDCCYVDPLKTLSLIRFFDQLPISHEDMLRMQVPVEWVAWPNDTFAWGSCACGSYLQEPCCRRLKAEAMVTCMGTMAWGEGTCMWGARRC